jgi:MFS family permease
MSGEHNPSQRSPHYTLVILTLLSALAFMDRQILSVVVQPVKLEFNLSDLQIGLVTGLGFALTFGLLGVPLGKLADKSNRRSLIAYARGLGGLLSLLGSQSVGFLSLMSTRSGGAVSDAGATPASMSMLADLYPAENRSRAMSVLNAGGSLGALMALVLGSWLAQHHGWRFTMALIGGTTLMVSLLLRYTVREPVRFHSTVPEGATHESQQRGAVAAIWAEPLTRWSILGAAFALLAGYSFGTWNFAMMVRHHGLSLQQAGWISGSSAMMSLLGGLASGALTDRLTRRDVRWQLGVPVLGLGLAWLCGMTYLLMPSGAITAAMLAVMTFSFFLPWWAAPTFAAISLVVPSQRRATANAMMLLAGAVVGNGMGAILTGWFSDLLAVHFGDDGLRLSLLGMACMLLPAMVAFGLAMRAYPAALASAQQTESAI